MKKFFHIPLLQCCKPFRLKETQTEVSFLAGNKRHSNEAQETIHKDSTSYSLEFDTSIQNNSSYSSLVKNIDEGQNNCGRCTKCMLVNFEKINRNNEIINDTQTQTGKISNNKDEVFLSVELDNYAPGHNFIRTLQNVPTDSNVNSFYQNTICKVFSRGSEEEIYVEFLTVQMFYFKTSVIMINTFQNVSMNSLNFSQAIHLKKIVQNVPLTVHPLITYLSFRCIQPRSESHHLLYMNESLISKIKVSVKAKSLHKSDFSETKFERSESIRLKDGTHKGYNKKPKVKSNKSRKKDLTPKTSDNKIPKPIPNFISTKLIPYNKLEDYKEFLEMWKMRRKKCKAIAGDKKESNASVISNSTIAARSPDSQTRDFMLKFINKQFKNKPLVCLNNKSITNSCHKSSRSKLRKTGTEKPSSDLKTQSIISRNKIIEILVEIIYDKVIILMVDKLSVLSNNFDEFIFGTNYDNPPSMYGDNVIHGNRVQAICIDNFSKINPSISSTSNTGDFTASTAFDIISDQAYSDNTDCPLSN